MSEQWRKPRPAPGTPPPSFVVGLAELRSGFIEMQSQLRELDATIDALALVLRELTAQPVDRLKLAKALELAEALLDESRQGT